MKSRHHSVGGMSTNLYRYCTRVPRQGRDEAGPVRVGVTRRRGDEEAYSTVLYTRIQWYYYVVQYSTVLYGCQVIYKKTGLETVAVIGCDA